MKFLSVCSGIVCAKCNQTKPAADFHRNAGKPTGHHSWCKGCANAARKDSRSRNGRQPNKRAYNLATRYGLTEEVERDMMKQQEGRCAICRIELTRHHIDHDHATGAVRGLLCARCNLGVGYMERPGFSDAALAYLKKHGSRQ